jgi:hypothetical protein
VLSTAQLLHEVGDNGLKRLNLGSFLLDLHQQVLALRDDYFQR